MEFTRMGGISRGGCMTHPSKDDSELGWIRIAVELGPCKFSAISGASAGGGDNKDDVTGIKESEANCKKFGATLHQNACGHGFIPGQQTQKHRPDFRSHEHDNVNSKSMLGASPSEVGEEQMGGARRYKRWSTS